MDVKLKEFFNLTGIPVLIASLCCIAPVVLVLLGISTVSFAASLTNVLEGQFQWLFILVGIISLIFFLILYFRGKGICTIDQAVRNKNEIINKTVLVIIFSIIFYIILFYGIINYIGKALQIWN